MATEQEEFEQSAKAMAAVRRGDEVLALDDAGHLIRIDIYHGAIPTAHHTTHEAGGSDEILLDKLGAPTDVLLLNTSTSAHGLCPKLDNDTSHFLNGQGSWAVPLLTHQIGGSYHSADTLAHLNSKISDATLDDHSDPRTPNAHAASHKDSASDEIDLDELGAPTDNTDLNVSTGAHGLCPKLPNDADKYLDGTGGWTEPPSIGAHAIGGDKHTSDTLANLNSKISDATLDNSSDTRDPNAHKTSHENGGGDEISVAGLSGELADDQPPKAHKTDHENGGGDEISVAGLSGELTDPQPPKTHAADHKNGQSDEILLHELGEPTDTVPLNNQLVSNLKGMSVTTWTEKTIATGVISVDQMFIKVDTQNDDGTDDLDTITHVAGIDLIVIHPENDARTVVVKHNTGNLWLPGKTDINLDDIEDGLLLVWDSVNSKWFHPAFGGAGGGGVANPLEADLDFGDYCLKIDTSPDSDHSASGIKGYYTTDVAVNFGDVLYMKSTGNLGMADGDDDATMPAVVMALGTLGASSSGWFLEWGWARDDSWSWTVGNGDANTIHVSLTGTTGNTLVQSLTGFEEGDWVQRVGWCKTSTVMKFCPSLEMVEIS